MNNGSQVDLEETYISCPRLSHRDIDPRNIREGIRPAVYVVYAEL